MTARVVDLKRTTVVQDCQGLSIMQVDLLVAELAAAPSQLTLEALLALVKEQHGALQVASLRPLLEALERTLSSDFLPLATEVLRELLPDSGPELEAHFSPVLGALCSRLGESEAGLCEETVLQYAQHSRNLEQVVQAVLRHGLAAAKWQCRARSLRLLERLMPLEVAVFRTPHLLETLLLTLRDSAANVQEQAKQTVRVLASLVPDFPGLLAQLRPAVAALYEGGAVQEAPDLQGVTAPNGLEFGFVPPSVWTQLQAENWRSKAMALQEVESLLETDVEAAAPYLSAFCRALQTLLRDSNLKVSQASLGVVGSLLRVPGLAQRVNVSQLVPSCMDKLGDNKIAVRQAAFKVFRGFLTELPPRLLFGHLITGLHSENWHVREAVLHVMMASMLADLPDFQWDFCGLIRPVAALLEDSKPKVAFTAGETLAVLAFIKGNVTVLQALRDLDPSLQERLKQRFSQGTLPQLKEDYIEFPKPLPTSAPLVFTQPAPDPPRSQSPVFLSRDPGLLGASQPLPREEVELPALRRPYLPISISSKAGGKVVFRSRVRRPLLRFSANKPPSALAELSSFRQKQVAASDPSMYAPLEQLESVPNPQDALQQCLEDCQTGDWTAQFEMLTLLRRLVRNHTDILVPGAVHVLVQTGVRLADSLRSSLARNSLVLLREMSEALGRTLDSELELLLGLATRKCGDTNVFISQEAEGTLLALCGHCSEVRVLLTLLNQAAQAKSSVVKAKIAQGLQTVFSRCTQGRVKDVDRCCVVLAAYLSDASPEVRSGARAAFSALRQVLQGDFDKVLFRSLPDSSAKTAKGSLSESRALRSQSSERVTAPRLLRRPHISPEFSVLDRCAAELQATEWKRRQEAVDELLAYAEANAAGLKSSPKIMRVVDLLSQALGDKSASVSQHALQSLDRALPLLAGSLEPHTALLLRALCGPLGGSGALKEAAAERIRLLCAHVDPFYSASALAAAVSSAGVRVKSQLLTLVTAVAPELQRRKAAVVRRHLLPLAFSAMEDPRVAMETSQLLRQLYRLTGSQLVESAPANKVQRLLNVINEM